MELLDHLFNDGVIVRTVVVISFTVGAVVAVLGQVSIPDWYKDLMLVVIGGYFGSLVPSSRIRAKAEEK